MDAASPGTGGPGPWPWALGIVASRARRGDGRDARRAWRARVRPGRTAVPDPPGDDDAPLGAPGRWPRPAHARLRARGWLQSGHDTGIRCCIP